MCPVASAVPHRRECRYNVHLRVIHCSVLRLSQVARLPFLAVCCKFVFEKFGIFASGMLCVENFLELPVRGWLACLELWLLGRSTCASARTNASVIVLQ